jgi:Domain of unknown function (DUF4430)
MISLSRLHTLNRRAVVLLATMMMLAASWSIDPAAGQSTAQTVRLVVDYGDGTTKTINDLPWAKGNTVLDVMKAATARPHGISLSYTGSDATTVITKIDDVQNQGGGAGKNNWQYWVNDTYGNRSFAVTELQAGDVVTWRFATEQGQ